jgi:membrane glycosyltransferase
MLLAPIRMLFHTRFVVTALAGWRVHWRSPPREDAQTSWGQALRHHGAHTLLGIAWAGGVYWLNPSFLWWMLPIAGALMLSIPISVYSSRRSLGRRARNAGLFVIPEELHPPPEIRATIAHVREAPRQPGFVEAVVDPVINALICAAAVVRVRGTAAGRNERASLVRAALEQGPKALNDAQRMRIVNDPIALSQLHAAVWATPDAQPDWLAARAAAQRGSDGSAPRERAAEIAAVG